MLPSGKRRLVFALALLRAVPFLSADIHGRRTYHGKRIDCLQISVGFVQARGRCGTQGFARVFTGTVKSTIEIGDTDKLLTLVPDEVFQGDPVDEVRATVNQACMPRGYPEIEAGDRWLFYLQYDGDAWVAGKPRPLRLPWDSPSKPLAQAKDDIARLHRLASHPDLVTIHGNVDRLGETVDKKPIPVANHKIAAKGEFSGEHVAVTDEHGHYELELPPDSYDVTANTERGLKEQEEDFPERYGLNKIQLQKGGCREVNFTMLADAHLAGQVKTADGKPAGFLKVAIIPTAPVRAPFTVVTDAAGHFDVGGRQPGRYLVGVGLLGPYSSAEWKSRVYFPGVPTQDQAETIELGEGEWRTDINFTLPASTIR